MTDKPKTILVRPNEDGSHSLTLIRGIWQMRYDQNGRTRRITLRTSDYSQAQKLRDSNYKIMIANGATMSAGRGRKGIKETLRNNPSSMIAIYSRTQSVGGDLPQYIVRVNGVLITETDDIEEARAARNAYVEEKL